MTVIVSGTVSELAQALSKLVIQGQGDCRVVITDPMDVRRVARVEYVEYGGVVDDGEDGGSGSFTERGYPESIPAVRIGC